MAEVKTKATAANVSGFLRRIADPERRRDCQTLIEILKNETGEKPRMWGSTIIGFGRYRYKYASGHGGESALAGFSPRRDALALYFCDGLDRHTASLQRLGKFKAGKGCLYVKRLADVDIAVLSDMIRDSVTHLAKSAS